MFNLCEYFYRSAVECLLNLDASVSSKDNSGCTPLHLAAWKGYDEICTLFLTFTNAIIPIDVQVNVYCFIWGTMQYKFLHTWQPRKDMLKSHYFSLYFQMPTPLLGYRCTILFKTQQKISIYIS